VPVDPGVEGVFPQVGYAIGTHCGNAVVRNTLRRRARATAREAAAELPPGTYLLRFEPAAALSPPADLTRCVRAALQGAGRAGTSA